MIKIDYKTKRTSIEERHQLIVIINLEALLLPGDWVRNVELHFRTLRKYVERGYKAIQRLIRKNIEHRAEFFPVCQIRQQDIYVEHMSASYEMGENSLSIWEIGIEWNPVLLYLSYFGSTPSFLLLI